MIRVAIIADTRLYREGLAQVLGRSSCLSVVATAARRDEALASLPAVQPDVILMDMASPDSFGAVRAILQRPPQARLRAAWRFEAGEAGLGWGPGYTRWARTPAGNLSQAFPVRPGFRYDRDGAHTARPQPQWEVNLFSTNIKGAYSPHED